MAGAEVRKQFATEAQVRDAAAKAKAVGIERIGAITLSPTGAITIVDASLARRFAAEADDGAEALSQLEAQLGRA